VAALLFTLGGIGQPFLMDHQHRPSLTSRGRRNHRAMREQRQGDEVKARNLVRAATRSP
jgi:hypothetical protein